MARKAAGAGKCARCGEYGRLWRLVDEDGAVIAECRACCIWETREDPL